MSASQDVMELDEATQGIEDHEIGEHELRGELQEEDESDAEAEEEAEEEEAKEDQEATSGADEPAMEAAPIKKKREKKDPTPLTRESGKSILPFSRVQKIIKADKDIPVIARDAVFLISLATESFIMELAAAAQRVAEKERRTTVQHKDIATVVRKADEFMFLEDLIPWLGPEPEKKCDKPTAKEGPVKISNALTLHDHFGISNKRSEVDVIMDEDGTMSAV